MKSLVIIGAGGVGQEVAWIVEQINDKKEKWDILGFIDDNEKLWGSNIIGYKVLGGLSWIENNTAENLYVIIAIANYKVKKSIVEKLKGKVNFAIIIHPDVYIHRTNSIGEGTIIYPGVIMTVDIHIGNHVIVSPKCGIGHNSNIKDYVSLLWNVNVSGYDVIEEGVIMGSGSTVIQNKEIGQGAVIGAGSVVVRDVTEDTTSVGNPAIVIKYFNN